ncbi:MAG TPA: FHA domain-containing protein [Xanthomonadales bacterium]|nr:FHA domain-containing protein [Xanthomonadales bacterium]
MRLLFPNGEHAPVDLKDGVTRVGSAAGSDVTLIAPGIAGQHCEIELAGDAAKLRVSHSTNVVLVNGKQVAGETPIKPGDLVLFAKVGARVVAVERPAGAGAAAAAAAAAAGAAGAPGAKKLDDKEDDGRTRIRQALPRFVLRGVSGSTFGKTYPLYGTMTVGRHSDCTISIPGEEISRHHARLKVLPDGIEVEDLGSANGTFINGKRVHRGTLKPGEELRLDTVRFLLVAPGLEAQSATAAKTTKPSLPAAPEPPKKGSAMWVWIILGIVVAGGAIAALFYSGMLK